MKGRHCAGPFFGSGLTLEEIELVQLVLLSASLPVELAFFFDGQFHPLAPTDFVTEAELIYVIAMLRIDTDRFVKWCVTIVADVYTLF